MMRRLVVVLLGVSAMASGCGSAPPKPKPVEIKVAEPGLPQAEGKAGVVFSGAGAPVELRVLETGESVMVPDGQGLTLRTVTAGKGLGRAEAEVEVNGKVGLMENAAVLVGERFWRSPDGAWGVFSAITACEPECQTSVWLVHRDGRRLEVTRTAGEAVRFELAPGGRELALSSHGLWLVQPGLWKVFHYKEFTSPAYAPDGSLFVRSLGKSDAVLRFFQGGQVAELASEPGAPTSAEPAPVAFEDGGRVVVATFARKGGEKTVRVPK